MKIRQNIRSFFDLRSGEGRLTGLMALYNFLLLITLYLLKPVRDSLFLVELGPQQLPYIFIITALVVIPISMAYSRFSSKVSLSWVIYSVTIFLVTNLIVIWWLVTIDSPLLYYILYVWVSIYSVLITSQFWLLANALYDINQAKRIFVLLSLAAITGAIVGGEVTGFLVNEMGISPQKLLLIGAVILFSTVFLVRQIRQEATKNSETDIQVSKSPEEATEQNHRVLFRDILGSRHLLIIVGIIAISVVTTTIIDYQFKTIASRIYETDNSLTTFMGYFYGRVSIIALLLQLFLSSKFIERRGVGGAVTILPTILLIGSVALFVWPGLIAAIFLRGTDQSLKHSVDRTGRELLFIPIDLQLKKRTKVFIDLFVDNGAQGLAGVLLILLTLVVTLTVKQLSIVVAVLIVGWLALAVWARRSYVDEFRDSLEDQVNESGEVVASKKDPHSFETLIEHLQSNDDILVVEALNQLMSHHLDKKLPIELLKKLLDHPNPRVIKNCLHLFRVREIDGYMRKIASYLQHPAPGIRLAAARYIYHFYNPEKYGSNRMDILREGLKHKDIRIRAAALGLIAKDGGDDEKALLSTDLLEETLSYDGEHSDELKIETARAIGTAYRGSYQPILRDLLEDKSLEVRNHALLSAGQSGDRIFIPILLKSLEFKNYKKTAQKALSMYGSRIYGTLFDYMTDEQVDFSLQLMIPPIFNIESSPVAARVLQVALTEVNLPVRHEVIRSMSKIKRNTESASFGINRLKQAVHDDTERYIKINKAKRQLDKAISKELHAFLNKEIAKTMENMFRLLGLIYNSDDIYNVYKGIKSSKIPLISEGIEFLENLIEWDIRKYLIPALESELLHHRDITNFEYKMNTNADALEYLLGLNHPPLLQLFLSQEYTRFGDDKVIENTNYTPKDT